MIQCCNSKHTYLKQHSLDFYFLGEKSRYDPWGNYLNLVMRKCNTLWLLYNNVEAGMKWKLNENHWSAFIQKLKMKTTHACTHVCGMLTKSLAVFQIQVWKYGYFPLTTLQRKSIYQNIPRNIPRISLERKSIYQNIPPHIGRHCSFNFSFFNLWKSPLISGFEFTIGVGIHG